jgi:hypothetical protein
MDEFGELSSFEKAKFAFNGHSELLRIECGVSHFLAFKGNPTRLMFFKLNNFCRVG